MVEMEPPPADAIRDVVLNAHGNFAEVQRLIEGDGRLLQVSAPWNETPLQAASHTGNRQIAEWLLDRGAPLDIFAAAMLGRTVDVERFLAEDPDLIHGIGVHGLPLLFFPAAGGQFETVALLLERGADINAGRGGNTALHAATHTNRPDMARLLLERGADPAALDYENKTPLDVARANSFDGVAAILAETQQ